MSVKPKNTRNVDWASVVAGSVMVASLVLVLYFLSKIGSTNKNFSAKDFKAGQCFSYIGGEYIYQVVSVGDYSLRVSKRLSDSIEDTVVFESDISNQIQRADCFDLFKTGLPVK